MSTKILVVRDVEFCRKCPCRWYEGEETDRSMCGATLSDIPEGTKILENCPLKSLWRIDGTEGKSAEEIRYIQGWNAAMDQIELG